MAKFNDIIAYLRRSAIPFEIVENPSLHISEMDSRTVFVQSKLFTKKQLLIMIVFPLSCEPQLSSLRKVLHSDEIDLLPNSDYDNKLSECDPKTLPPFGHLYGCSVFADASLKEYDYIMFFACTQFYAIKITVTDFLRFVRPSLISLSASEIIG